MKERIKPIDGLRAIAAFGVVWVHVWTFYGNPELKFFQFDFYQLISIVGNGVDFFFVISGFCMYLMASNQTYSMSKYYTFLRKRFLRIAPAFYTSVIVYAVIIKFTNTKFDFFYNVLNHFLFLNNITTGNTISAPFWSIGTEWHFYMILPILILFAKRFSLIKTIVLFSILSIVFFCIVNMGFLSFSWWEKQIVIRFPEFGIGIIAAYYFRLNKRLPKWLLGFKGIFIAILIMYAGRSMKFTPLLESIGSISFFVKSIALPFMDIGFAILLYHTITEKSIISKILSSRFITYLGRISYSIYLWHSLAILLLNGLLLKINNSSLNVFIGFVLVCTVTIPLAHLSYNLLESFYFKRNNEKIGRNNKPSYSI